jgi:hypothetical protein
MAYLIEQAGGKATTGKERILDVVPTDIHQVRGGEGCCGNLWPSLRFQSINRKGCFVYVFISRASANMEIALQRVPVFLGCREDIDEIEALYKKHGC